MFSLGDLFKEEKWPKSFDHCWWMDRGLDLARACSTHLNDSASFCVMDGEAWVWNHDQETIFKINPAGTAALFKVLDETPLSKEDRAFANNDLMGTLLSGPSEPTVSTDVNTDDTYFAFRYLRSLAMERNTPIFPALEVTYVCNYDCRHCYRPQEEQDMMSLERWKSLLVELKASGTMGVVLTGGEVTAWKHIRELIEFIRSIRMAFVFKTNGHLINEDWVHFLLANRCHEVHISLYGPDGLSNDYVTRREGSFDRILRAIRMCAESGLKVRISSSLTEKTFDGYEKLVEISKDIGVGINIDPLLSASASPTVDVKKIRATHEQVRHFCDGLGDALAPEFRTIRAPGTGVCSAARSNCSISPTGNVYPCVGYWYKEKTLSVLHETFSHVWGMSPIIQKVRKITNGSLKDCSACSVREFCPRCLGAGYEETGSLTGISPNNCIVAEGVHANYMERKPMISHIGRDGSFGNRCS